MLRIAWMERGRANLLTWHGSRMGQTWRGWHLDTWACKAHDFPHSFDINAANMAGLKLWWNKIRSYRTTWLKKTVRDKIYAQFSNSHQFQISLLSWFRALRNFRWLEKRNDQVFLCYSSRSILQDALFLLWGKCKKVLALLGTSRPQLRDICVQQPSLNVLYNWLYFVLWSSNPLAINNPLFSSKFSIIDISWNMNKSVLH